MAIALAGTPNTVKTSGSSATTPAMDSTSPAANLLILGISAPDGAAYVEGKDSLTNTWTNPGALYRNLSGSNRTGAPHVLSPTTGASQTFTTQTSAFYQGIVAAAFSGVDSFASEDGVSNTASGTSHPTAASSVTPSADGALIISVFAPAPGASLGTVTPPTGLALLDNTTAGWGVYVAYEIQTTATTRTLTWTTTNSATSCGTSKVFLPAASSGVTGTVAYTNANDTSSASGTTTIVGTVSVTNANDTSSASGSTTITGTISYTNLDDTSSASGSTTIIGTVSFTNADDTSSATGTVGSDVTGTVAYINLNDIATASGSTTIIGTVSVTNNNDTSSASGFIAVTGTSSTTNNNDICVASGISGNNNAVRFTLSFSSRSSSFNLSVKKTTISSLNSPNVKLKLRNS